jgi:tetratricopeptide (TPR) repeat protein
MLFFSHFSSEAKQQRTIASDYLGSSQCRSCHEKFYELWAPSHHGLAMHPYTQAFAKDNLTPQAEEIEIGNAGYRAVTDNGSGFVLEVLSGKETQYPILHVLGGKNVYYFLTKLDRGRLQVLPVAYDLNRKQWFDTAASAVRHFPDRQDQAVHWTDRAYTFNTSCYGCHVSQLVKNYDAETDSYHTQWKEPGINCETCHGPAAEHVRVCLEAAAKGEEPKEMKLKTITQSRGYTAHQVDTACSTCHAKMMPLTAEFVPGEDFFQHYDLVTLENSDYYPDGRDLGENYTYTSWRMSPCVQASKLDCLYCHTSSGRYRFKGDNANEACTSCHTDKKDQLQAHSHHDKGVAQCIQCHMPKTEFGRMVRSDHSMRPPMPSATIRFQSPNACNLCHKDKSAEWADSQVRKWHQDDYQKPVLEIAGLINQARKGDWTNLPEMLAYLQRQDKDEIFACSLVRFLQNCPDERIQAALIKLLQSDPSPLIRGSAADGLQRFLSEKSLMPLLEAARDPYRLVRVRAAATLALVPEQHIPATYKTTFSSVMEEYKSAMMTRPDDAASHYNLGNYYQIRGSYEDALESYKNCQKLRQDYVPAYVNASIAYNALGKDNEALRSLENAIQYDPNSVAAHLNMALLYGEMGRYTDAEKAFRRTFELDSKSAVAAYNLGVLAAQRYPEKAIDWCRRAYELEPTNSKYAFTLAYYYNQQHRFAEVIEILRPLVDRRTDNY